MAAIWFTSLLRPHTSAALLQSVRPVCLAATRQVALSGACFSEVTGLQTAGVRHASSISTGPVEQLRVYMANKVGSVLKPDLYNEQERQVCSFVKSSGVVDDVFDRVRPIPSMNLYANDNEGWDELEKRHRYFWSRFRTGFRCNLSITGYSQKKLKLSVIEAHKGINAAIASGKLKPAEPHVTEVMMDQLTGDVKARQRARWAAVDWKLAKELTAKDVTVVNGRIIPCIMSQHSKLCFVQFTVKIESQQVFAAYADQAKTQLLAGDPEQVFAVEEYWVMERPFFRGLLKRSGPEGAHWRVMARLTLPSKRPDAPEQPEYEFFNTKK